MGDGWRIVFMGTPAFARTILEGLLVRPDPVVAVVCQPDRPRGRGLAVSAPEVKELALAHRLPVLQPERVRDPAFIDALRALAPDLVVVAAYGRILPRTILDLPPRGCINVHASLLPRHRGAAPVAWAIMAGDATTGVSIMNMVEEMDAGDVLLQRETPIAPDDTTGTLTARLARLGATALGEAIDGLHAGTIRPVPQDRSRVTFAPRIEREQARIDWRRPAEELERLVRALSPAPVAFTTLEGRRLQVHRARVGTGAGAPGRVITARPSGIVVGTGSVPLVLLDVQLEGRRRMSAGEFVAGRPLAPGTCLGDR
ncbi:MAG TPA: methionyl-tRNA formyltransferase [Candidatus Binatia bacterium]|nr:methionyl-tRNA formyltransferase [Candidatus Binatia bacterium]